MPRRFHKRSNSELIANDPFRAIEKNALSIFDAKVRKYPVLLSAICIRSYDSLGKKILAITPRRRRHSELIPNDPFRQIELNAEKIFDVKPEMKRRHSCEFIPNDPFRTIELHAPEIFGDLPTPKQKSEFILNDPFRAIELHSEEIFH
jgi:hypothetical protein